MICINDACEKEAVYGVLVTEVQKVPRNTGKTGGKSDFLVAPTRLVPIQAICEPSGQF
jgi:hypothetical protein